MKTLSSYSTLVADLEGVIGMDATARLCELWPGIPIRVPAKMTPDHVIAREIGIEKGRALSAAFGGAQITPPRLRQVAREARNRSIIEARRAGATVESIARRHEMTVRQVYNVLADSKRNANGNKGRGSGSKKEGGSQ